MLALARAASPAARVVVLDLAQSAELDLQTVDALGELADGIRERGGTLVVAAARQPVVEILRRGGVAEHVRLAAPGRRD